MTQQPEPTRFATRSIPWWLATIVILGALLTAAGGLLALVRPDMLLASSQHMNAAAHVYAGYLVSRNLALAVMLLTMLALRSGRGLAGLMVFSALVQAIDAAVDVTTGRVRCCPSSWSSRSCGRTRRRS